MAIIPPEFDGRIRPHAELLAPTLVRSWQNSHVPNPASATHLGWSPDGRALTYVRNTTGSTQNLYMQPLDGSPEVQLTHFDSEPAAVAAYAWSRDGKRLAITRARYNDTDVVMFSGFR